MITIIIYIIIMSKSSLFVIKRNKFNAEKVINEIRNKEKKNAYSTDKDMDYTKIDFYDLKKFKKEIKGFTKKIDTSKMTTDDLLLCIHNNIMDDCGLDINNTETTCLRPNFCYMSNKYFIELISLDLEYDEKFADKTNNLASYLTIDNKVIFGNAIILVSEFKFGEERETVHTTIEHEDLLFILISKILHYGIRINVLDNSYTKVLVDTKLNVYDTITNKYICNISDGEDKDYGKVETDIVRFMMNFYSEKKPKMMRPNMKVNKLTTNNMIYGDVYVLSGLRTYNNIYLYDDMTSEILDTMLSLNYTDINELFKINNDVSEEMNANKELNNKLKYNKYRLLWQQLNKKE